jgi:trehalose 6-phosphate phosphatase
VERGLAAISAADGVEVEDKGLSATVHVRRAPDPAAALARVRQVLAAARPPGLELRPGRMSLELRPVDAGDKGTALRAVVARHHLRGLVVLGDDVTDVDMFRAAAQLRAEDGLRAAILAVRGGREVPAEVEAAADAVVGSPGEAVALLRALLS